MSATTRNIFSSLATIKRNTTTSAANIHICHEHTRFLSAQRLQTTFSFAFKHTTSQFSIYGCEMQALKKCRADNGAFHKREEGNNLGASLLLLFVYHHVLASIQVKRELRPSPTLLFIEVPHVLVKLREEEGNLAPRRLLRI